uniref:NAC domain-containing protein n=1 Tax=Fagus sylvatica TaxID=28930 RepID=A0A2N9IN97_FAGSY
MQQDHQYRTTATGTWNLSNTKKIYDADGNHIGFNMMLSFKQKDDLGTLKKTSWTMHELSLADALSLSTPTNQQCCNNVVLCVIYNLSHKKDEDAAAAKMCLKRSSSSTVAAESDLDEGTQQHSKRMKYCSKSDEFQALQPTPEPAPDMPIPVLFSSPSEDILDLEIIFEELDDLAESHTYTDDLAAFFADLPPMTEDWNQLVC